MSNQKRLEEYLIGNEEKKVVGYLKDTLSNGKVIMLSGKWGSGKTHFWKNIIEKDLIEFQTKKQKAYVYTSLYGNTSINKIEDNIYAQSYLCAIGGENYVLKGYKTFKDFGKRFGSFCSLLDISKLIDGVDEIQKNNIKNSALLYLEKGGIVCFDDFERKSKDIDLNDLFGFISHLAIDLNCKVVIILNDDVYEGEEKKIFSNVKEKSVSKFLKYEPSIRDLFKSIIFEKNSEVKFKYSILRKHLKIILNTIEKTQELNARIYIQVLDNLVEWIDEKQKIDDDDILRCLVLVNINFILYHNILTIRGKIEGKDTEFYIYSLDKKFDEFFKFYYEEDEYYTYYEEYELQLMNKISSDEYLLDYFKNNKNLFKSHYFANRFSISECVDDKTFQKINNFIETGILINE